MEKGWTTGGASRSKNKQMAVIQQHLDEPKAELTPCVPDLVRLDALLHCCERVLCVFGETVRYTVTIGVFAPGS